MRMSNIERFIISIKAVEIDKITNNKNCFFLLVEKESLIFNIKRTYSYFIGILLSQSSEFGFIILDRLFDLNLLDMILNNILLSSIILTMISTPILIIFVKQILLEAHTLIREIALENQDLRNHVIIAGYDKSAKILTSILKYKNIAYVGIESNRNKKINQILLE